MTLQELSELSRVYLFVCKLTVMIMLWLILTMRDRGRLKQSNLLILPYLKEKGEKWEIKRKAWVLSGKKEREKKERKIMNKDDKKPRWIEHLKVIHAKIRGIPLSRETRQKLGIIPEGGEGSLQRMLLPLYKQHPNHWEFWLRSELPNLNLEKMDRIKRSPPNLNPNEIKRSPPNLNLEKMDRIKRLPPNLNLNEIKRPLPNLNLEKIDRIKRLPPNLNPHKTKQQIWILKRWIELNICAEFESQRD